MKKKIFIISGIFIISLILLGFVFGTIDYFRAKANKKPIFAIGTTSYDDGGSRDYYGLGYKVIKCNTLNGDKSVHIGFYHLNVDKVCNHDSINEQDDYVIVDETKECPETLEEIYRDEDYIYYLPCIQSETIFVKYNTGEKISIKEALKENIVTFDDLLNKGLKVNKNPIKDEIEEEPVNENQNQTNNSSNSNTNSNNSNSSNSNNSNNNPPTIKKYTVSFNSNGGSGIGSQAVNENSIASKPSNPTRNGYIFNGWTLNGSAYNFNVPVTSNITLVANWNVDPTPEWSGQYPTFSTKTECQTEGLKHSDYVPQCDDIYNKGGVFLGWQLMLTKKNSNPLEQWIWQPGSWIKL